MVRPEDEPALERKSAPLEERKKKARMGRGVVIVFGCYAALALALYIFTAIYMASNPNNAN
ncbi:hypothetical protein SAMN03159496_05469 [Rhizobium sp. NFR07]|uniref:hypothetical protein n=1 Tax=Rhizobium sp. NFR07 TaxID=1566262 RepID=UPI0008EB7552|nr:hypothetical protein [Rhizobium sp. NFR07]SFB59071.1 hypothetical protein SAMN03159496_05469 [Rhizobium sp. NFR07]